MSFMSSLASNPSGSIASQPGPQPDPLDLVYKIKNREKQDFIEKANFMSDLSLKQDRLRRLYDPQQSQAVQGNQSTGQQQQMLQGMDPSSPANAGQRNQQAELGIKQQQANTESQRVNQQGQFGQQAQDTRSAQEKLNQQKSDQINAGKIQQEKDKQEDYRQKMDLATKALSDKNANLEAQLQAHKNLAATTESYHKSVQAQKDLEFQQTHGQMQQKIDQMTEQLKQRGNKTTTTTINPEGTSRTTSTRQGSSAQNVIQTLPNGDLHVKGPVTKDNPKGEYDISPDKLDHWNSLYGQGDQSKPQGDQSQQPDESASPGGE